MTDYYKIKAISSTALGYIDFELGGSPKKFKQFLDGELEDDSQSYLRTGSLIHLHVLEPDKFVVADVERPSDTICAIADGLYTWAKLNAQTDFSEVGEIGDYRDHLLNLIIEKEYQSNWKDDTRINKVIEQGKAYFDYLKYRENTQEIVLSSKEFAVISACSASLKTDPHVSKIMFPDKVSEGVEILREEEFFFTHEGEDCKAKLDYLVVNHNKRTFTIVDLKTTSKGINNFRDSFQHFRYDKQFAFYIMAVQSRYPDYQLNMASIVAVETTGYYRSRLFIVPEKILKIGRQKVDALFNIVKACKETSNWEYEPEYLLSPYIIDMEL